MAARLLLIEDHRETARLLTDALEAEGFEVAVATTGEQGLLLLQERTFDIVVVDFLLPLMTGIHVIETLAGRPANPPAILITGAGLADVTAAAIRAGAFGYVEKHGNYLPGLIAKIRAAIAGQASRLGPPRVVRSVFVGRDEVVRRLDELMAGTVAGQGRIVYLVGEPGIGKTALARLAAEHASTIGLSPLWGRCRSADGADAYAPWREIHHARRRWRAAHGGSEDGTDGAAAYVARLVPQLESEIPLTWDLAALESEAARLQRFGKVVHFCRLAAEQQPMLLLLEDAHLIDSASLQLLGYLAEHLHDMRVMVLAMLRCGEHRATAGALEAIAADAQGEVIRLQTLSREEVALYVERATDCRPTEAVVSALYEKAEGHPLFTVELLRLLVAKGQLVDPPSPAAWAALSPSRLPAIDLRLEMLPESHVQVLSTASLIGREFEVDLLRMAIGDLVTQLEPACAGALAHGLLTETDTPDVLRFSHELVRDELVRRIPRMERVAANLRIARALERRYGAGLQPYLSRLARHCLDGGDLERGIDYAIRGAERQCLLMAYPEAIRLYAMANDADGQGQILSDADRCKLLTRLAEAHWRADDLARARDVGRQAFELAKQLDRPELLTPAALSFAGQLPGYGPVASDETIVAALEYTLGRAPPKQTASQVLLLSRLIEELQFSLREVDRESLLEKLHCLARRQRDPKVEATALRTGQWTGSAEEPARRPALAERYVSLAVRANDPMLRLDGELLYLYGALEHGTIDGALQHLRVCSDQAAALRLPYYTWLVSVTRACVSLAAGQLDAALDQAQTAHRLGVACGNPNAGLFFSAQWAQLLWLRGELADLQSLLDGMAQQFPVLGPFLRCARAAVLGEAGDLESARAELRTVAADGFAGLRRNVTWLTGVAYLAEASARTGATECAGPLYQLLEPFEQYVTLLPPLFSHGPVAHQLGALAATLDRPADAERHFQRALALEERMGARHWVARTTLELAQLSATSEPGDARRVTSLLDVAERIADELRLPIVATRCAEMRGRLSTARGAAERPAVRATPRRCAMRRVGGEWEVQIDDQPPQRVRHSNGVSHITALIRHKGLSLSVFQLDSLLRDVPMVVEGRGGKTLDPRARREGVHRLEELRARHAELAAEEADLERDGSVGAMEAVRARREAIEEQIEALVGWRNEGARPELGTAANTVRTNVQHAIATAIRNFKALLPALGAHLEVHVETGWDCTYFPDSLWAFEV
jgi:CheY-like chemotaxis protein